MLLATYNEVRFLPAMNARMRIDALPEEKRPAACIACGKCAETGHCIFTDDPVNEGIDLLRAADGLVVGAPVYYAGPNATLCAFLDRVFFMKAAPYAYKPACAVVSCRARRRDGLI